MSLEQSLLPESLDGTVSGKSTGTAYGKSTLYFLNVTLNLKEHGRRTNNTEYRIIVCLQITTQITFLFLML